ncbi:hypothetical protein CP061683_0797A, partial [Chlamydia psittaci 06-1683]
MAIGLPDRIQKIA